MVLDKLEPNSVWKYFEELCQIPHSSGHNEKISSWLVEFAKSHGLKYIQDEALNVIIFKDGSKGLESHEPVILQGHMDMVAEKASGCEHNFSTDGLDLILEGDYVGARGTTLGGDDGIGVAMILAILADDTLTHPPIEAVITVDEEVGMLGAAAMDCSVLNGKTMINLDSEDEGVLLVGCAGGVRCDVSIPVTYKFRHVIKCKLIIDGLSGGHSGQEINQYRANAHIVAGRILIAINKELNPYLLNIDGGTKDNAIPRTCTVTFAIDDEDINRLKDIVAATSSSLKETYSSTDPDMSIRLLLSNKVGDAKVIDRKSTARIIYALNAIPDGVIRMSPDVVGLPETSLNMGICNTSNDSVHLGCLVRSSIESEKENIVDKIRMIAGMAGASVTLSGNYPGFKYQVVSPLRKKMAKIWTEMFDKEVVVEAIHAGVECGLFASKIPGLDCISIGPDMKDIHTPSERLSISSTERVYRYVVEILKQL